MSIEIELNKLIYNLSDSYKACEEKEAILPENKNFDNLPSTIRTIEKGTAVDPIPEFQEYDLPEELRTGELFHIQMPNGDVIISSDVENIGVWVFNYKTKTFSQEYNFGSHWKHFQIVGNNCLISAFYKKGKGLLIYRSNTGKVTLEYSNNYSDLHYFKVLANGDCLIGGGEKYGLLLYRNDVVTPIWADTFPTTWYNFQEMEDSKCLIFSVGSRNVEGPLVLFYDGKGEISVGIPYFGTGYASANPIGHVGNKNFLISYSGETRELYLFNGEGDTFTSILYKAGNTLTQLNNTKYIVYNNINWSNALEGIILYDDETMTAKQIYNNGRNWDTIKKMPDNRYLIGSSGDVEGTQNTKGLGTLVYNDELEVIESSWEKDTNWFNFYPIGDNCIITGNAGSGALLYRGSNKSITKEISDSTALFDTFWKMGDNVLIPSQTSEKILIYRKSTATITMAYNGNNSTISYFNFLYPMDNNGLIGSQGGSGRGVLYYNSITETINNIYNSEKSWGIFERIGNNCLIGGAGWGNAGLGLLLFKGETKEVALLKDDGYSWTGFHVMDDISFASTLNYDTGLFIYDNNTMSISQLTPKGGYYLHFGKINNNNYFIGGSAGLFIFNKETYKLAQKTATATSWNFLNINNKIYALSGNLAHLIFDYSNNTFLPVLSGSVIINDFIFWSKSVTHINRIATKIFRNNYISFSGRSGIIYSLSPMSLLVGEVGEISSHESFIDSLDNKFFTVDDEEFQVVSDEAGSEDKFIDIIGEMFLTSKDGEIIIGVKKQ